MVGIRALILSSVKKNQEIESELKKSLPSERYLHSKAVAQFAAQLATIYHVDPNVAITSGLLHDCAKGLDYNVMQKMLKKYSGRYFDKATRENQSLWHNPCGVLLARQKYKIKSPSILRAIALHSTGDANMNTLDKIIYIADFAEPTRKNDVGEKIRLIAGKNIDDAVRLTVANKVEYLKKNKKTIHPRSIALVKWINAIPD